jgi:hypothetical protein
MHTPFLDDIVRLHTNELQADARRARQCRELTGPSVLTRLTNKWRRPTVTADPQRHASPVAVPRAS